ncbi:hypothetical protein BKA93DRAFT_346202 [Sparassis latifolia]
MPHSLDNSAQEEMMTLLVRFFAYLDWERRRHDWLMHEAASAPVGLRESDGGHDIHSRVHIASSMPRTSHREVGAGLSTFPFSSFETYDTTAPQPCTGFAHGNIQLEASSSSGEYRAPHTMPENTSRHTPLSNEFINSINSPDGQTFQIPGLVKTTPAAQLRETVIHPHPQYESPQVPYQVSSVSRLSGQEYPSSLNSIPILVPQSHTSNAFAQHSISSPNAIHSPRHIRCQLDGGCDEWLDDLTPGGLNRHIRAKHVIGEQGGQHQVICRWRDGSHVCGRSMSMGSYGRHLAAFYLRTTTRICDGCHKTFCRFDVLKKHQKYNCRARAGHH